MGARICQSTATSTSTSDWTAGFATDSAPMMMKSAPLRVFAASRATASASPSTGSEQKMTTVNGFFFSFLFFYLVVVMLVSFSASISLSGKPPDRRRAIKGPWRPATCPTIPTSPATSGRRRVPPTPTRSTRCVPTFFCFFFPFFF